MALTLIFMIFTILKMTETSVDLKTEDFEFLADRLSLPDCRRLVAALHVDNFQMPREDFITSAVRKLPQEASCLDLLLDWNSNDGSGKTHTLLTTRLLQMDHQDLADELSTKVFHELTEDLNAAVNGSPVQEDDVETGTEREEKKTTYKKEVEDTAADSWTEVPLDIEEEIEKDAENDDDDENMLHILISVVILLGLICIWCRLLRRLLNKQKKKEREWEEIPLRDLREYS